MKQPNIQEVTKQKLQNFYWPLWFPYPTTWLKSLILTIFLRVIIFVVNNTGKVGYRIAYFVQSPELFAIFTILLILSPIPIISFTHHCLHLLISRFISEIQAPEIGRTQGLLPRVSASNFVALDTDKKLKILSRYQFFIQNRTNCRK